MINRIVATSFLLSIALTAGALAQDAKAVSQIDRAMFFDSEPNDVAACGMSVADDGSFQFPEEISSPAATCPDAMSWKGFFEAIQAEFWKNWASERQIFPAEPLAMCDAVFDKAGIAGGSVSDPDMPSPDDPAWRSYRLKGSQTRFVSDEGHPTAAGHSVAEAGFVNTSSCLTCHTQASVDGDGQLAIPRFGLALKLNLFGYQESPTGAPDLDWFYRPGGNSYIGFRTDFVWGVRYAKKEIAPDDIKADRK